ncbi:hypothetical protein [Capnocytophaga canis]|uniref:hypothetical protein n=1 Tax=Capnocytophaga canis TaxID=1848903 RepID=UPI0037D452B5
MNFLLLVSMLKVAFPVGEFFHEHHEHHSAEEICTHATNKKCQHEAHFSDSHQHPIDCIFFQLHNFFVQPYFIYTLLEQNNSTRFVDQEKNYIAYHLYTSTRAPPSVVLS